MSKVSSYKIHIKQNKVPWLNSEILQFLEKKASFLKKYKLLKKTPESERLSLLWAEENSRIV